MTKKEALAILGLEHPANRQMIENRYARLIKGYYRTDPEKMAEVNEAYKVLTEDSRKVEISPRLQKQVAGKSLYQWKNFLHYARIPALVTVLALALVISIIYSVSTKKDPDFVLAVIGNFYNRENNLLEDQDELYTVNEFIIEHMEVERPLVELLSIGSNQDPQMEVANMTKRILYAGGMAPADVFLLDEANFENFHLEGVLVSLEDFFEELLAEYSSEELSLLKPVYGHIALTDEEIEAQKASGKLPSGDTDSSSTELDEWISAETYIVGFDFSETQIFNGLSMLGHQQILSIPIHNEDREKAFRFIRLLIDNQDEIQEHSPGLVQPSPSPAPTSPSSVETGESGSLP